MKHNFHRLFSPSRKNWWGIYLFKIHFHWNPVYLRQYFISIDVGGVLPPEYLITEPQGNYAFVAEKY